MIAIACIAGSTDTASIAQAYQSEPASAAPQAAPDVAPIDVSSSLDAIVTKHAVPSIAALVVRGDGTIVMQGVSGVRQAGRDTKATLNDLYHLGSCTKAMTATLGAILVDDGVLSWDATLGDVFPDSFAEPATGEKPANAAWKPVTMRQLATHRSGIPSDLSKNGLWSALWRFKGEPTDARRVLLKGVLEYEPIAAPGVKHEYSNGGYAVLGLAEEVKGGEAWETLIQRRLFTPLGITTAGFGAPGTVREKDDDISEPIEIDQPRGHRANGAPVPPGPGADNPQAIAPAGTAHMTIGDWSKFVALHLRGARGELRDSDPVSQAQMKVLHTPVPADGAKSKSDQGYALGWSVTSRPWGNLEDAPGADAKGKFGWGDRVLTHTGSNTMWFCVTWLSPERDFAVLVVCNRGGDAGAKASDAAAWMLVQEFGRMQQAAAK